MRSKLAATALLWAALALTAQAQEAADETEVQTPPNRPENQVRPLPADTFLPSEEISEDFPVPFPVDI